MTDHPTDVRLTDTQHAILAALCRPISGGNHFATPATNQEIADEVFLSVDAVKGHLRTLYRKFGIEDLPHNQKRARLVELAIEGGYVKSVEPGTGEEPVADEKPSPEPSPAAGGGPDPAAAEPKPTPAAVPDVPLGEVEARLRAERAAEPPAPEESGRSIVPYITMAILILVVAGATLAISGVFNSSPSSPDPLTTAAYRARVDEYCELALAGAPSTSGQDRAKIATGYLEVIETMSGRLKSLVAPTVPDVALERFSTGLTAAANYTSAVAQAPPAPGSAAEAKDVAELTFAAGQVQAGAVGYGLGHDCSAIGDLVARSAENAAAP